MDPATAFQVAASVIAFVDFGRRLLSDASRVYKSPDGRASRTVKLSVIAEHLRNTTMQVENAIQDSGTQQSDSVILALCQQCQEVSMELQSMTQSLTRKGPTELSYEKTWTRARKSFVVAAQGLWREGQVRALNEKLDRIYSQLMMALMVSLWRDTKLNGRSDAETSSKLDSIAQTLDQDLRPIAAKITKLRGDDRRHLEAPSAIEERGRIARHVWGSDWERDIERINIRGAPEDGQSEDLQRRIEDAIVESLAFVGMDDRSTTVPASYGETFRWILPRSSEDDPVGFRTWLRANGRSIFWITGKPGSGKSTLMKYITQQPSFDRHLRRWAGRLEPLWAGYYFWDAGSSSLQRSRAGMMMTLLHHLLRKRPSLIPVVTPRRWALYSVLGNTSFDGPSWTWEELYDSFSRLAEQSGRGFRLALFIDGLDEFGGDPADIVAFIKLLNAQHNIKICVASRPWTALADALAQSPSLTMQDLTKDDIMQFVVGSFEACPAFHERQAVSPAATTKLVDDIIQKADGVFLWVSLVVQSLVISLMTGHNMVELQDVLDRLPLDMIELYTRIWQSIEPDRMETSSRLLQIKIACLDILPLDAKLLWVTLGESLEEEEQEEKDGGGNVQKLAAISSLLRRKLTTHTMGILGVSPSGYVEFLHRSAKDWAKSDDVWVAIRSKTPAHFDPSLELLKAANTYIIPKLDPAADPAHWGPIKQYLTVAANVVDSLETTPALILNLDQMDRVLSHNNNPTEYSATHWSTTKFRPDIRDRHKRRPVENSFVALAAQYAIRPYVLDKVRHYPGIVTPRWWDRRISLLESAIYGSERDCPAGFAYATKHTGILADHDADGLEYKPARWFCTPQRLGTIRDLLDAGDSPNRRAHMHDTSGMTLKEAGRSFTVYEVAGRGPRKLAKRSYPVYSNADSRFSDTGSDWCSIIRDAPQPTIAFQPTNQSTGLGAVKLVPYGTKEYWDEVKQILDGYNYVVLWWRRRRLRR